MSIGRARIRENLGRHTATDDDAGGQAAAEVEVDPPRVVSIPDGWTHTYTAPVDHVVHGLTGATVTVDWAADEVDTFAGGMTPIGWALLAPVVGFVVGLVVAIVAAPLVDLDTPAGRIRLGRP